MRDDARREEPRRCSRANGRARCVNRTRARCMRIGTTSTNVATTNAQMRVVRSFAPLRGAAFSSLVAASSRGGRFHGFLAEAEVRDRGIARARTLSAVRSTREGEAPQESVRVERALAALKFELDRGCQDSHGRRARFSEYAKIELTTMGDALSASARRAMWNDRCKSAFERYDELSSADREVVINVARRLLENKEDEVGDDDESTSGKSAGKQSLIEGDAWRHALEQRQIRRLEVEAVMHNGEISSAEQDQQGSGKWFQLRASRLTASAFGNAIGFWGGGRNQLWEEKLGLREAFSGNEATEWGSSKEDEAVRVYEAFAGKKASHLLFQLLSTDDAELWIGASPDGLIGTNAADVDGEPGGVLEIKCPFNKGSPETAKPYAKIPWYYVPQVQGLMAVFDRPWCDLVSYTTNGGVSIYRVERDHEYWALLYSCLSDFWWQNVIPAKHALAAGKNIERYRPSEESELCAELKRRSKEIADKSATTRIDANRVAELRALVVTN